MISSSKPIEAENMHPIDCVIADFAGLLDWGVTKPNQMDSREKQYIATMKLRAQFRSVQAAVSNDEFLQHLHATLSGFFRLARRTNLKPIDQFKAELGAHAQSIASFEGRKLSTVPNATSACLWHLIHQLNIADCKRRLVSGTKTLHVLLPDLVVPVDGRYTGAFLFRYSTDFDEGDDEQETFKIAFATFQTIAKAVTPETYVGKHPMHTTPTKVIDNAVIGFVERARHNLGTLIPKN
jgi:hypothetical protein